jgi:hypothetical protein
LPSTFTVKVCAPPDERPNADTAAITATASTPAETHARRRFMQTLLG